MTGIWFVVVFILLGLGPKEVTSQSTAARCDPQTLGSGSGSDPEMICGDNSVCQNNAECLCTSGYFSATGTQTDCRGNNVADPRCVQFDRECVYCGSNFQGPCSKCTGVIYNGQCLSTCPEGTQLAVHTIANVDLPVRTCTGTARTQALQQWAIIVIIVLGVAVLFVIAILIAALACTCLRRSNVGQLNIAERQERGTSVYEETEQQPDNNDEHEQVDGHNIETNKSAMEKHFEIDDDYYVNEEEKKEFFTKIDNLRDQSEIFLKMLNDMRRRLKELPPNSPTVQQYKNVMRDLTRLLYMLNKKPEKTKIPPDGVQLLTWSEQILNRYLLAQGKEAVSSPARSISPTAGSPQRFSSIGDTAETDF